MNKPLHAIHFPSDAITSALHLSLSMALQMSLDKEEYIACAGLKSAMEDLEIQELLNGKDI